MALLSAVVLATAVGVMTPIGGHHGVSVWSREGSELIDLRAEGDFAASPLEVEAVLTAYGEHPRIVNHLVESRVLARQSDGLYVYQHLNLPVISDRDYTLHVTWQSLPAHSFVRFVIDNEHGPGAQKNRVRMTLMTGQWELIPVDDGRATHAVYHVQVDFAGSVPAGWFAAAPPKSYPICSKGFANWSPSAAIPQSPSIPEFRCACRGKKLTPQANQFTTCRETNQPSPAAKRRKTASRSVPADWHP